VAFFFGARFKPPTECQIVQKTGLRESLWPNPQATTDGFRYLADRVAYIVVSLSTSLDLSKKNHQLSQGWGTGAVPAGRSNPEQARMAFR
jgi:hypothetical protein